MVAERPLMELAKREANRGRLCPTEGDRLNKNPTQRETEAEAGSGRHGQRRRQMVSLWDRIRHHLRGTSDKPGR